MTRRRNTHTYAAGKLAEAICIARLWLTGWRILAVRWRCAQGEVDIIARRGSQLCFIEVKSRSAHAKAYESVTAMQQNRIRAAASLWMAKHAQYASLSQRFDVMSVAVWPWPKRLTNAF